MTASPTVRGSGYAEKCVLQHSSRYIPCFESDVETIDDYIMIWMSGDPTKIGTREIEVNFEGTTATFNCATDAQWDPVKKRYGIPIALRPSNGKSGIGRCRIKGLPQNGYERVMSFDVWFNYPGTTNYYDRHANAIYVSGADFAGSGAIGTNDATVGTSGDPNYRLNRAFQFAGTTREGCYVYIKGHVRDDTNGVSTPTTNVLPCEIRPWPGYTREQTKFGCTSRAVIEYSPNIWKLQFYNIQVDTDNIINIRGAANGATRGGFRNCTMLGNANGGLDVNGIPIGLFFGVSTNSQSWVRSGSGEEWSLEDCSGEMFCAAGFRIVSNVDLTYGWDAFWVEQNAYSTRGYSYWGYRVSGPSFAYQRFHLFDDLEVVSSTYDAVNQWTRIAVVSTGQLIQNNSNETAIVHTSGPLTGTEYWAGLGVNSFNYLAAGLPDKAAAITGASTTATGMTNFPSTNTVYLKGVNRTADFPSGALIRVYNYPHKDAFQTSAQSDTNPWVENGYLQNYKNVALDPQGMLLQSAIRAATSQSGTVGVLAGTATFSASKTYVAGQTLEIRSGPNIGKYAVITASGTGTTAPLDRADLNGTSAASYSFGFGECVVTGNTVAITGAVNVTEGMSFSVASGPNQYKYAIITSTGTGVTSFTLDRTDLDGTVCVHTRGLPLRDFVFENRIVHRTMDHYYLFQWEAVGINLHFINATLLDTSQDLYGMIKNRTSGFGARNASFRDCIIGKMQYSVAGTPYCPDITFSGTHFNDASPDIVDATKTLGDPAFDSSGLISSNYYPTGASVGTVSVSFVPFDLHGNVREAGDKVGAVAKVGAVTPPSPPGSIPFKLSKMPIGLNSGFFG